MVFWSCGLLTACTFQTKPRGYIFPDDAETQIARVKTVGDLTAAFGDPSAKTVYGDPVWIYYGVDENYRGPLPLRYENKRVLLAWVRGNRVTATKFLTDADLPDVDLADGATPIPAEIQLNAIQEMFNNIGRFSPGALQ